MIRFILNVRSYGFVSTGWYLICLVVYLCIIPLKTNTSIYIKIALSREFGAKNNLSANRDSGKSKIFTGEAFPHQSAHRDA